MEYVDCCASCLSSELLKITVARRGHSRVMYVAYTVDRDPIRGVEEHCELGGSEQIHERGWAPRSESFGRLLGFGRWGLHGGLT
jgi:hypothetical protein